MNPHILLNSGILEVCRCILPEGSVVNPGAAGGGWDAQPHLQRHHASGVWRVLAGGARSAGGRASRRTGDHQREDDVRGREPVMASIGPVGGGAGGSADRDGAEGSGANACYLRNTPVEIIEAEVPIQMRHYGLAPDSGGPGRFRGGSGLVMEFQVFSPNSVVTARNRDRTRFASWGVCGGKSGLPSRFTHNPGGNDERELRNIDVVKLDPGDVLRIQGPGAGGYGYPDERDPRNVLDDVRAGLVSLAAARESYGVVIDTDVDLDGTARLRERMRNERHAGHFDFGRGRVAFEATMTPERYRALDGILSAAPVTWRFYLKHQILTRIFSDEFAGAAGAAGLLGVYGTIRERFPHLPQAQP